MTELRGEAPPHTATQATPVWRAPKGPEGQGGLRDRPLRAEGSCVAISRAAGPDGARTPAVPQATKQQGLGAGGPGCGARGRRRGLAGLRDDAPSEARSADGSRAGRRPRAHQAARPRGRARRRPEHQRRHQQHRTPDAIGMEVTGGHTKQPGHAAGPDGARNTSGAAKQPGPDTRKPRPADAGRGQPTQSGGKV